MIESPRERVYRHCGRLVRSPAAVWMIRGFFRRRINIIFYHAVWSDSDRRRQLFGGMERRHFAREIAQLARVFDFVPLAEQIDDSTSRRRPSISITFDDGFDLTAGGATDVLDQLGISATVFVNSGSVRYERLMWQHRISAIRALRGDEEFVTQFNCLRSSFLRINTAADQIYATQDWPMCEKDRLVDDLWSACAMPPAEEILRGLRPYFDWDGLRDWTRRGHSVGFHTRTHPFCSRLSADEVHGELIEPVEDLRKQLSIDAVPFAYPFGHRLVEPLERDLARRKIFTCLLGTGTSFSLKGEDSSRLTRVEAEAGIDGTIFGRPILRRIKNSRDEPVKYG